MAEKVKIVVTLDPSEAKKGAKEVIQLLAETEVAATSAGTGLKGISDIGKSGIQDLRIQKNSVEDLDARIKMLTKSRDKWADPTVVARYNKKIAELGKYKKELTDDTRDLTEATTANNNAWQIGTIAVGNLAANVLSRIADKALDAIKASRQLAFQVEETASKFKVVLGPSIATANRFIDEHKTLLALSNREAQEYVAQAVQVGKSLQMQSREATEFGTSWVKLAGDYQSFFDIPFEEAFTKIRSGLTGEWTALKQLGIAITEAEVKERALLDTGLERAEFLSQSEISQARFSLIVQKSGDAMGNMARTQDEATSKTRQMNAAFRDLAEEMAQKSIPLWGKLAEAGLDFSKVLRGMLGLSITDKLQAERLELNLLSNQLITAVKNGNDRSALIAALNDKYPDYLKNLDQEKLTVEGLSERLKDANRFYEEKTLLQVKQEELSKLTTERSKIERAQTTAQVDAVEALIKAEAKLGIEADLSTSFWERRTKVMTEADEQGANLLKHNFKNFTQEMFEGTGLTKQIEAINTELEHAQEVYSQIEAQFNNTKIEVQMGQDEPEPIPMPIKPFIDPSVPIAEMLEESLPEVPELEVGLYIESDNLAFLYDSLASAEQQYTQAATTEERKRHQDRMESLQKEIEARKEGITVEQLLEREAHQERMAQVVEYIEQINEAYQLIAGFQGAVTDRRIQSIQHEKEAAVSSIDAQLSNTRLSERQRDKLLKEREAAEVAYQKKIDKLQREQFERERLASLAQVAANTAVAVAKVWSQTGVGGVFAQALPIAMGIIQAGTIIAQPNPYLDGGLIQERLPTGQTAPGKKLISINENNKPEFIMNALSAAKATPFLNRMNKDPDFAERINKAYTGHQRPNAPKSEIGGFSSGIDTNSLNAAVRSGIEEAMKDVRLHVNLAVSEIFDKSRIFEGNQDAVGNQA